MKITCSFCKNEIDVFFVKKKKNKLDQNVGTVWREEKTGKLIYGPQCFSCCTSRRREKRGHHSREKSPDPRIKKAVETEKIAAKRFESLGFIVTRVQGTFGPDLFCRIGELEWTVEVKPAQEQQIKGTSRWYVNKVSHPRKKDDLIAIVMPNGYVYLDSMKGHLAVCPPSGNRHITALVKEFGMPHNHP